MSPQRFLIISVITAAALTGASVAIANRAQSPALTAPVPQAIAQPVPITAQPVPPLLSVQPAPPTASPVAAIKTSAATVHSQLKQAIQERNLILLKSLIRSGALRESLRDLGAAEPVNFENLDASAWTILDKAIDYRCRSVAQTNPGAACFE